MEAHSYLKWSNHARCLISNLGDTLEREEFVDVTLATSDGLFLKAHRLILCAASPYFQELLSKYPADTHVTIILSEVNFEHLRALVQFIYKGKVSVPPNQLPALLESASSLRIKGLVDYANEHGQQQRNKSDGLYQEKNVSKVVPDSARPIDQIPTQSEDPLNWEEDTVVMREEANNDSDTTALYELEENLISEDGALDFSMNKLPSVPSVVDLTSDSIEKPSDRSRKKRKKKHHSHNRTNSPHRPSASKRKSSDIREEWGSSRKRSLNDVSRKEQEKEPQVARDGNPPALLQNSEFIANKQSVNKETNFLKIVPGSVVSIPMWPPFQPEKFYTTIDKENNPDLVVNSSKRDLNIKQQQQQYGGLDPVTNEPIGASTRPIFLRRYGDAYRIIRYDYSDDMSTDLTGHSSIQNVESSFAGHSNHAYKTI